MVIAFDFLTFWNSCRMCQSFLAPGGQVSSCLNFKPGFCFVCFFSHNRNVYIWLLVQNVIGRRKLVKKKFSEFFLCLCGHAQCPSTHINPVPAVCQAPCQLPGTQRQTGQCLSPPGASQGHQEDRQVARNHDAMWQVQKEHSLWALREQSEATCQADPGKAQSSVGVEGQGPGGGLDGLPGRNGKSTPGRREGQIETWCWQGTRRTRETASRPVPWMTQTPSVPYKYRK